MAKRIDEPTLKWSDSAKTALDELGNSEVLYSISKEEWLRKKVDMQITQRRSAMHLLN